MRNVLLGNGGVLYVLLVVCDKRLGQSSPFRRYVNLVVICIYVTWTLNKTLRCWIYQHKIMVLRVRQCHGHNLQQRKPAVDNEQAMVWEENIKKNHFNN